VPLSIVTLKQTVLDAESSARSLLFILFQDAVEKSVERNRRDILSYTNLESYLFSPNCGQALQANLLLQAEIWIVGKILSGDRLLTLGGPLYNHKTL
jgi:hypothetical protein